jgi:hypothetical protein
MVGKYKQMRRKDFLRRGYNFNKGIVGKLPDKFRAD